MDKNDLSSIKISENEFLKISLNIDDKEIVFLKPADDNSMAISEGIWEPWHYNFYKKILKDDSICIDIGGNIGCNAIYMALIAKKGKIFSFEPIPKIFYCLEQNIQENKFVNIYPYNFGLGEKEKEENFFYINDRIGDCSRVYELKTIEDKQLSNHILKGKLTTLDNFLFEKEIKTIDLIKIDVEGFEEEVLLGAKETIKKYGEAIWVIEFSTKNQKRRQLTNSSNQLAYNFYHQLKKRFNFIFYLSRDNNLMLIENFSQLLLLVDSLYGVDDLVCTNSIEQSHFLLKQIKSTFEFPEVPQKKLLVGRDFCCYLLNRYGDGWSSADNYFILGSTSGLIVSNLGHSLRTIKIIIRYIYPQHSLFSQYFCNVYLNDTLEISCDLQEITNPLEHTIHLESGLHYIAIESSNELSARTYLGNPNDPRKIGINWEIEVE